MHLMFAFVAAVHAGGLAPSVEKPRPDAIMTTVTDTTWYVTNRARTAGTFVRAAADSLEYGYVVVRYRERIDRTARDPWAEGFTRTMAEPVRLTRAEFLTRIGAASARAGNHGEGPVVYTHGFATSFGRSIAQGSDIAHRGRYTGPFIVFSWPAHTAFASLPRLSAWISKAYRDDSTLATSSQGAFRGTLTDLLSVIPSARLTVLAHSLGAQLASEALSAPSPVRDALAGSPLHALVLFAPDIAAARFRDVLGPALAPLANRRVIYASETDRLLDVSRLINHSPRAGQLGGEQVLSVANVEIVDVTLGRRTNGILRNIFEPHHAMRYASSALRDFFGVVRGTPGDCRAFDGLAVQVTERSWRLTSDVPPAYDVGCLSAEAGARAREAFAAAAAAAAIALPPH